METVTISKDEYDALFKKALWSEALEVAGVDNWEGIDEAIQIYREMKEEE